MDNKDFGPSYDLEEWVLAIDLGWGQILSCSWLEHTWQYRVRFDDTGLILLVLEEEILF